MNIVEISPWGLAAGYLLLIIPLALALWSRAPIAGSMAVAVTRMTVQLLLVGLYLQVIFRLNNVWLTGAWLVIMIGVADASIVRGCGLRLRPFAGPLFISLAVGAGVPLAVFMGPILGFSDGFCAQYAIPIGGMIVGNCLRGNIVGLRNFYETIHRDEKAFLNTLAQGARLSEALRPYWRDAVEAALAPTIATMATIGLVSLPGMMTGVILAGADPMTAIKYQIAIMIAIFSGTALTVALAIRLTLRNGFTPYGVPDRSIFRSR
jgi:putative ABC transport system permease protein